MITYNTFIQRFKDFADNHYFIRSFSHGAPEDVDLEKFNEYPLMHVIYTGANYEDTTKTLSFEVYIFDLPSHYENKQDRQKEVVSDAEQCAEDVIADIVNGGNIFVHEEDYTVQTARVTPLQEESSNVLAGVLLEVDIQIPYDRDACNAPIDGVSPEGGEIVYARRGVLRVRTVDSATDVLSVRTIVVPNGTLTDDGGGQVTLNISGAGDIALDDLTDVALDQPLDREALVYDEASLSWINGGPAKIDFPVYNATASTITKGTVVGFAGGAQGDRPTVSPFSASSATDVRSLVGVAMEDILPSSPGHVRDYGTIYGINTNAYSVGTILYASTTAGQLTSTAPSAPNHRIAIAVVTRQQINTGRIFVRTCTPGYNLGDLSNVDATITTEAGKTSVLKWNATTSRYETGTFTFNQLKGIDLTGLGDKDLLIYDDTSKTWKPLSLKNNGQLIIGGTTGPSVATLTAGTNITVTNGSGSITIAAPNVVTGVTGTAPIVSSGGTSPAISITAATTSAAGSMSASDKSKLDGITAGAAVASVTGTAPIVSSGGTTPAISISAATTSAAGSMSSADKSKLNGIASGAEVNQNAFSNVAVSGQTTVAADTKTDTLTLVAGSNITLTTDAATDSITIAASGGGPSSNAFGIVAVSGQSNVEADASSDTLTLVAGANITLTTSAAADSVTFAVSGLAAVATSGSYADLSGTPSRFFSVESSSSTAYTLLTADAAKYKRMTATTAITVTVNTGVFSTGDEVLFEQNNTGQITVAAGSGVTLRNSAAFQAKSSQRYSVIGLKCVASNEYILTGERALV
jgi:hypothetical protein